MTMFVDGVKVNFVGIDDADRDEAAAYVAYVRERVAEPVKSIIVTACPDGCVDVNYTSRGIKFERIRRITGYLVGTIDRWNDAKQSEERDRVKHEPRLNND